MNSLRLLVVARATTILVVWTCVLEDVGAIYSVVLACHGGRVKPHVTMLILLMPSTFQRGTAYHQAVSSEWRERRAALLLII